MLGFENLFRVVPKSRIGLIRGSSQSNDFLARVLAGELKPRSETR